MIFIERELERAKAKESVLYANYTYEIANNYITEEGLNHIKNIRPVRTAYPSKVIDDRYFSPDYSYNQEIEILDSTSILFSIRTKSWIERLIEPAEAIEHMDFYGKKAENYKPEELTSLINSLISINEVGMDPDYERVGFWATKYSNLQEPVQISEVITKLGLDWYAENEDIKLYGMVFTIEGKIFKPNVTNNPSAKAYCSLPLNKGMLYGGTMNLHDYNQDSHEFMVPQEYFTNNKLNILKLLPMKLGNKLEFNKTELIRSIYNLLEFEPEQL